MSRPPTWCRSATAPCRILPFCPLQVWRTLAVDRDLSRRFVPFLRFPSLRGVAGFGAFDLLNAGCCRRRAGAERAWNHTSHIRICRNVHAAGRNVHRIRYQAGQWTRLQVPWVYIRLRVRRLHAETVKLFRVKESPRGSRHHRGPRDARAACRPAAAPPPCHLPPGPPRTRSGSADGVRRYNTRASHPLLEIDSLSLSLSAEDPHALKYPIIPRLVSLSLKNQK